MKTVQGIGMSCARKDWEL